VTAPIYTCLQKNMRLCECLYVYVSEFVCMCVCACVCTRMSFCLCVCHFLYPSRSFSLTHFVSHTLSLCMLVCTCGVCLSMRVLMSVCDFPCV